LRKGTFWLQGTVSNPIFPHPLLIGCISTAIASGFLQFLLLALRIFRRKFGEFLVSGKEGRKGMSSKKFGSKGLKKLECIEFVARFARS
jgi:hypothetical protein